MSDVSITGQGTRVPPAALLVLAFIAGFLAVPLFHQPMLALLHALGVTPATPYAMRPLPPFGAPQVLFQSFWGGVWGIVFALIAPRFPRGAGYWVATVLFGAFALSLVAWFIVAPIKRPADRRRRSPCGHCDRPPGQRCLGARHGAPAPGLAERGGRSPHRLSLSWRFQPGEG